jgi:hypothetical protein
MRPGIASRRALAAFPALAPLGALVVACGAPDPRMASSMLLNYDQLQKNPVDAGWIPARLLRADGQFDDTPCEAVADTAQRTTHGEAVRFLPDGSPWRSADWTALNPLLDPIAPASALKVTVINIVRVDGKPHYRYLSNGTQNEAVQTWSSSKPLAFAAMASQLRAESGGEVGIDGWTNNTNGEGGSVPVGDLMSIATVYRERVKPYNSNNLGTWAQNVSGRPHSTRLVTKWLGRTGESLGGGYGDDGSGLGGSFRSPTGVEYTTRLSSANAGANMLSTLTFADFYRRIVLHRELQDQDKAAGRSLCDTSGMGSLSLPCATWGDMKTILFGAEPKDTRYLKDRKVGGMMGGMSTLLHRAASNDDPRRLDALFGGRWKIFTKVGWGTSAGLPDTRWHGYGCFPKFDASGASTKEGKEFMISVALLPMPGLTTAKADLILQQATRAVVTGLLDGSLK